MKFLSNTILNSMFSIDASIKYLRITIKKEICLLFIYELIDTTNKIIIFFFVIIFGVIPFHLNEMEKNLPKIDCTKLNWIVYRRERNNMKRNTADAILTATEKMQELLLNCSQWDVEMLQWMKKKKEKYFAFVQLMCHCPPNYGELNTQCVDNAVRRHVTDDAKSFILFFEFQISHAICAMRIHKKFLILKMFPQQKIQ